ncbi:sulfate ABC transporter permease subunit CysW [Phormidium pseudopriestleyi FRX01]|uniref:Sulfate ABC transporter permease subunit CysW n=1 Tax=Phormidium pseudopriestleyi FRX01 TaxID=1759528 RepID=A0ABS3FRD5_9CYAN|nr:sulfate ABC transporter permease subunit CysW [Phormidium pseudopriestleyi]MBO0349603.1 sulfate ABC transporter permease subunit CysW [Phormidium pseudopriestleyi FRX01]
MLKPMSDDPAQKSGNSQKQEKWVQRIAIGVAIAYLGLVLFIPAFNVFYQAFRTGFGPFFTNFRDPNFLQAIQLTVIVAAIVLPINTIFGLCAAWAIARHKIPGRAFIVSIIDLPFSISPVVAGLMIVLLYGRNGWFGPLIQSANIQIIFALPGIVIASLFVTLPFVARSVIPVLEETGPEQEEAAKTLGANDWQIFWRITLPNIRWGLLYGVILTNARAMGEFGAVAVVSGNLIGKTQTLPLFVEEAYKQYQTQSAFSAAALLACLGLISLVGKEILERQQGGSRRIGTRKA